MSHNIEHIRLVTFTPIKLSEYKVAVLETTPVKANLKVVSLANIISKNLSKPINVNIKHVIKSKNFMKLGDEELSYVVYLMAASSVPLYLYNFDPQLQCIISYISLPKDGVPTLHTVALVTRKNFKNIGKRQTFFIVIAKTMEKNISMNMVRQFYKMSWNLIAYKLRGIAGNDVDSVPPQRVYTLLVQLTLEKESDVVEVAIPEFNEAIKVRIPIRKPEWSLNDMPPKLRNDIETIIVKPILNKASYAPRGILITGPPGVGKTVSAEAISSALKTRIVELRPSTYRSMWYGLTEKILEETLQAVKRKSNVTVLLDDVDFLVGRHIAIHETHVSEITIFLRFLQSEQRPLVILTTNTPELLDPALIRPGRIDVVMLMGYPDREFRKYIAIKSARRYGLELKTEVLDIIADSTRWFTHAEIDALIRLAASKSEGNINEDAVMWARQRFAINESIRKSIQDRLRWFGEQFQGITIKYVPNDNEII
ncbi:MAG: ATP-binding protein [Ignisphaera sp.]